jgi:hypothetical protein
MGNTDPLAYVLSATVHRRHLTREQKSELIDRVLKVKPNQSNRMIARQVDSTDKTVAKRRHKLESTAEIPQLKKTVGADGKERKQPKQKPTAAAVTKPVKAEPEEDVSLAAQLHSHLNAVWGLCQDEANWPPLNSGRSRRRSKALKNLRSAWSELVELAKPAPRRGRPPKGRAS